MTATLAGCAADDTAPTTFGGATMGTTYTITIGALPAGVALSVLRDDVESILERIDDRMSTYDDGSEVSRFNATRTVDWFDVSRETTTVVAEALEVSALTGGAFDVTVGPLVGLWGFGATDRAPHVPSDAEIAATLQRVGYRRLHVRTEPPALRKTHPDLEIDLSAIAKGYAVDAVAEHLAAAPISAFLVEVGGEMRARGRHPRGTSWRIGIETPVPGQRSVHRVLHLEDRALATSGDYREFFEVDGQRFSHTIDPRTGRPVDHELASVSVLDASSMRADALATGLTVLGPERALALAKQEGLAVLFILRDGAGFREEWTPALIPALANGGARKTGS